MKKFCRLMLTRAIMSAAAAAWRRPRGVSRFRSLGSARYVQRTAILAVAGLIAFVPALVAAPSLDISGLDSNRLLTRNEVDLYVTVTDESGNPVDGLEQDDFAVEERPEADSESGDEGRFTPVSIREFLPRANEQEGVTFQMLVDNSGSMYYSVDGEDRNPEPQDMRIAYAEDALREFIGEIDNPRDKVGLASFNAFYTEHTEPTTETGVVDRLIEEIDEPSSGEGYTELYASLIEMARSSETLRGRRVVVLLSDGANYPVAQYSGAPHPEYGERIHTHEQAIEVLNEQELTVFAVHFGEADFDQYLERIAEDTGGLFYNARTGDELRDAYEDIREQVLQEYRLTYTPTMEPAERRQVRVRHTGEGLESEGELTDTRSYVAGTLFGRPSPVSVPMLLIPPLLALLLWFLLTRLRLRNRSTQANFEVFSGGRTQVFPASSEKTVLGGGDADVTVVGPTGTASQQATVVYDSKKDTYTLSASSALSVNNRKVTRRDLEPGDVIRLSDTLVVFDTPQVTRVHDAGADESDDKQADDRR